jgi:A/G-specific adenine glycosylase
VIPDEVDEPATYAPIRRAVIDWYRGNARPLAFRRTSDPWAILVSEFMAQQTQAARAAEAWERFLVEFPTPAALADASPADALRAWRGLGYNRRALALRAAAREIVDRHGGRVPRDLEALDALPGVGPYTARALAALAFGRRFGAVDTNVRRVLGRAFFDEPAGARELQATADAIVPADRPGEWTHALMDVGATFCRPRNPRCATCPLQPWCRYAARSAADGADGAPRPGPRQSRAAKPAEPRFESTSRWLRGRILDRLRDGPSGAWVAFDAPIGQHPHATVATAIARLANEHLLERRDGAPTEARLPTH